MGFIVTKLPDNMDPVLLIQKEIKKRYGSKCPFCEKSDIYQPLSFAFDLMNKKTGKMESFKKEQFVCNNCGAQWESDPYPINIISADEYRNITNYLFNGEE